MKNRAFALGLASLLVGCCSAAEFSDDFADNLLTDLAPYVSKSLSFQFI